MLVPGDTGKLDKLLNLRIPWGRGKRGFGAGDQNLHGHKLGSPGGRGSAGEVLDLGSPVAVRAVSKRKDVGIPYLQSSTSSTQISREIPNSDDFINFLQHKKNIFHLIISSRSPITTALELRNCCCPRKPAPTEIRARGPLFLSVF